MNNIISLYRDIVRQRRRLLFYLRDRHFIHELCLPKLSKKEKEQINKLWEFAKSHNYDLIFSRAYKKIYKEYTPFFINDYQLSYILERFNPQSQVSSLEHKGLLDIYFPSISFPNIIARQISGNYYDKNMSIINEEEVIKILNDEYIGKFIIIKPTVDTGCGRNVQKIKTFKIKHDDFNNIIQRYKGDCIIQECLTQCEEISLLNTTSVNSCRITSIFINGKYGMSSLLKVGKKDSVLDNWNSSYLVGIDESGQLKEFGLDVNLNKVYQSDNGIKFNNVIIPKYKELTNFVENRHKRLFPQCGIIGWDIIIDKDYRIRVIEINLLSPGVVGEQMVCGPFFKDFQSYINNELTKSNRNESK